MRDGLWMKGLVVGIIMLFIGTSVVASINEENLSNLSKNIPKVLSKDISGTYRISILNNSINLGPRITYCIMTNWVSADGSHHPPQTHFDKDEPTFLYIEYDDVPSPSLYYSKWYKNDKLWHTANNYEIGGTAWVSHYFIDGLQTDGDFYTEIYINNQFIEKGPDFIVGIGRNYPPNIPIKPSGPTLGTTGNSYTFSTITTDQDNDKVMYCWDWNGDSLADESTSLQTQNTTVNTSHKWKEGGTYNVKVLATDEHGYQSNSWSPILTVTIENVIDINGGFGVSAVITNTGTASVTNLAWSINVTGGWIILSGSHTEDIIDELAVGASTTIKAKPRGIGPVTITVQADDAVKEATAFLLGPLVLRVTEL